ncbi:MAG: hypothetical protein HY777_10355 [Betaproteobacteria bacterium]|nr:hypothetical protein [Betaproteobacteria bacterium]
MDRSAQVFGDSAAKAAEPDIKTPRAKIGRPSPENGFFRARAHRGGRAGRKTMIDRTHDLPVVRQCRLPALARSAVYPQKPASPEDLAPMRRTGEPHPEHPFAGSRCRATRPSSGGG